MSNKTQSDGFGWDELWAGFKSQPLRIQREWMLGFIDGVDQKGHINRSQGLAEVLTGFMKNSSKKIQDEVFEFAPDDVKKYFGYVGENKKEVATQVNVNFTKTYSKTEISPEVRKKLNAILEAQ